VHVHRQTCRHAQPSPTQPSLFKCADGRYAYLTVSVAEPKTWQVLVDWMDSKGMAAQLTDPAFSAADYRRDNFHEIQEIVECFLMVQDSADVLKDGQAAGLPVGILNAPEDLFGDEHLVAREFFVDVEHEGIGKVPYPGAIYRFSSFGEVPRTRAPKLGEHTKTVVGGSAPAKQRQPSSEDA
jgi:crotonobetainyl-CoA:carnitine CoA-transferase CaiB-like acyl-CoA transferase